MRSRQRWLPVVFLLAAPAGAHAQVKLAWQFKEGDRFFVQESTQVRQTIKARDTENRQDLNQTKVSRFTILKKNPDGGLVLEQTIASVLIKFLG